MYTIPEDCPSQIAEEVNDYNATDNLFNKARSLTESGEIIISHEYSLDDIPEGIPLEDPIYDNLTKQDGDDSNNESNDKNNDNEVDYKENDNERLRDENDILLDNFVTKSPNIYIRNNDNIDINKTLVENIQETNYNHEEIVDNEEKVKTNPYESEISDLQNVILPEATQTSNITNQINNKVEGNEIYKEKEKETLYSPFIKNTILNKSQHVNVEEINNNETIVKNQLSLEKTNEIIHKIHIRDDSQESYTNKQTDNSKEIERQENKEGEREETQKESEREALHPFSSFHIIDSERDLEVPSGIEGPVPAIVLPPKNYIIPRDIGEFIYLMYI